MDHIETLFNQHDSNSQEIKTISSIFCAFTRSLRDTCLLIIQDLRLKQNQTKNGDEMLNEVALSVKHCLLAVILIISGAPSACMERDGGSTEEKIVSSIENNIICIYQECFETFHPFISNVAFQSIRSLTTLAFLDPKKDDPKKKSKNAANVAGHYSRLIMSIVVTFVWKQTAYVKGSLNENSQDIEKRSVNIEEAIKVLVGIYGLVPESSRKPYY